MMKKLTEKERVELERLRKEKAELERLKIQAILRITPDVLIDLLGDFIKSESSTNKILVDSDTDWNKFIDDFKCLCRHQPVHYMHNICKEINSLFIMQPFNIEENKKDDD